MRRLRSSLIVLVPLFFLLLACGGSTPEQISMTPTLRPTFTPAAADPSQGKPTPQPQPSAGTRALKPGSLWQPSSATSLRINQRLTVSGTEAGETVQAVSEAVLEFSGAPRALHARAMSQGMILGSEFDWEAYQLGEVSYTRAGNEWSRGTPEDLEGPEVPEAESFLDVICGWRWHADAEYEGMPVEHWTLTTGDLLQCKTAGELAEIGALTGATGNLMVVPGSSDFVHLDLILEGTELKTGMAPGQALDEGRVEFVYELTGLNQPFAIEVPDEALSARGPLDLQALTDLSELSSYRGSVRWNVTGTVAGETVDGALETLVEYTAEPEAQHVQEAIWAMDVEGSGASDEYEFQDATYVKLDQGWQVLTTTEEIVPQTGMIDPHDMLEGTCGWRQQADVEYRGVLAHHWTMATADSLDCPGDELLESGKATSYTGDVLIAAEGNYVLHLELVLEATDLDLWLGSGDDRVLDEGRAVILLDLADVNQPFAIQAPPEGLSGEPLPEDLPIPEGAEETSHIFRVKKYLLPQDPGEIRDFYASQMRDRGWTEVSAEAVSYVYRFSFSKDGRLVHIAIGGDKESGPSALWIFVQ